MIGKHEAALAATTTAQQKRDILVLGKQMVDRFAPPSSSFREFAERGFSLVTLNPPGNSQEAVSFVLSALRALQMAYTSGYMQTFHELVHAELFSDFLEQAEYLLVSKFKDAAAVIAGGVLEEHLRKLCNKMGIATVQTDKHGKTTPKKLDTINTELAKASVYDKNEHKQVTAWAGVRNDAAHGDYGNYDAAKVGLMIQWLRGFVAKYPA